MDRRERNPDLDTALLAAFQGHQAGMWTAMPGIVQGYSAEQQTVSVEVSIKMQLQQPDGSWIWEAIKPLVDCPVVFPSGGGFTLTFPVKPGDECLVVFANRCIDAWWQSGGVQIQADLRMHDLSDGFALLSPRSQPRVLTPTASITGVELRSDTRTSFVRIDEDDNVFVTAENNIAADAGGDVYASAGVDAAISAAGVVSVVAPTINISGNVNIIGNLVVSGTMTNATKNVGSTHTHSGVQTGGGNTGAPN